MTTRECSVCGYQWNDFDHPNTVCGVCPSCENAKAKLTPDVVEWIRRLIKHVAVTAVNKHEDEEH